MKIIFLIRSLHCGGAERQLVLLAKGLREKSVDVKVFTFYSGGVFEGELQEAGIFVRDFQKKGRWDIFSFVVRLMRELWLEKPDVLHGYLPEPNLVTLLFKWIRPKTRVVWGIRATDTNFRHYHWLSSFSFNLSRFCSIFADLIIVNSKKGRAFLIAQGYSSRRMSVIQNGVDVDRFRPDRLLRSLTRAEWGVGDDEILVGLVARFDLVKDHETFLTSASLLKKSCKRLRFVCAGKGEGAYFHRMVRLVGDLGLEDSIIWAGERQDMPAVYNAIDVSCLVSSSGEGFPNAIAESMACGVPCVVTDVGDAVEIVGDVGVIVRIKDPSSLASGVESILRRLETEGDVLKEDIRNSIVRRFSKGLLVERSIKILFPSVS